MKASPPLHTEPVDLPRVLRWLGLLLVVLTAFSFAFVPLRSSQDEWWHLKAGQWIVQNRQLPTNDIFTYTGEDLRWYNHEWLSQVAFYAAYTFGEDGPLGGIRALILFKALVVALTFGLVAALARVRGARWAWAIFVALLAAEISRRTIYPRPPIFSYLLLTVFLLLFYGWKVGRLRMRWLWMLVPLTVLWGNLHGMVLLAIVAAGAFAAGEALELAWSRLHRPAEAPDTFDPTRLRRVVVLTALTAAVTLAAMVQPSGYHLFFLSKNFTADPLLSQVIAEMKPPPLFMQPGYDGARVLVPGFLTFWVAAAGFPLLLLLNRGRLRFGADYLLSLFFLYQALNHWRLLPLFAIVAAAPAAGLLTELTTRWSQRISLACQAAALAAIPLLAAFYVFFNDENGTFFQRNRQLARGEAFNHIDYPKPLLDYLVTMKFPGRLLSETNYCGYFMWRLSPEHYKLFTDNRFDLFGSRFHRLERIMFAAKNAGDPDELTGEPLAQGWQGLMQEYGINLVVMHRGAPLHAALLQSGEWTDVYYYMPRTPGQGLSPTDGWSVWVRNTPEAAPTLERAHAWWKRNGTGPTPAELDVLLPVAKVSPPNPQNPIGSADWRVPVQP